MPTTPVYPFVPVEEYLRTDYEPSCEYVDGELKPKSMAGIPHSVLQGAIIAALWAARRQFGFTICPEVHMQVSASRFRVPDIAVLSGDVEWGRCITTPPLFTIEIVSPDESWSDLQAKVKDHLEMGVKTVIVADPYQRSVLIARAGEPICAVAPPLLVPIEIEGKGTFTIDFDRLFADLD